MKRFRLTTVYALGTLHVNDITKATGEYIEDNKVKATYEVGLRFYEDSMSMVIGALGEEPWAEIELPYTVSTVECLW